MIRINLMPFRAARTKENIRRQISVFLLSLVFVSVVLYYFANRMNARIKVLEDQVTQTRLSITAFKKKAAEVDKLKKKLDILQQKTDIVNNLELTRWEQVRLLETLTEMVVESRMWFTELQTKDIVSTPKTAAPPPRKRGRRAKPAAPAAPPKETVETRIKLKGYALDNQTVSDFLKRLENASMFTGVELIKTEQKKIREVEVLSFGINLTKVPVEKPSKSQEKSS